MIKHITYHILHKEQNGETSKEINPTPFIPNDAHQNFLDKLTKAYKGKAGKGFGTFDADEDSFPMPKLLRDYSEDNDFQGLTVRMMNVLSSKIESQAFATGGKVFISHYEDQAHDYMLIAILSDKTGFSAQNWEMIESEMLDIEHLKYAGRIDLTAWQANESRYVSFLKGQGDISQYFKEFLACNDALEAKNETKKLVELLEEFTKEQEYELEEKTAFFHDVKSYLTEMSNTGGSFAVEEFANRVYPSDPALLQEKLSNADNGVQDGFTPYKTALIRLTTFAGKTKNWRLSFVRNAVLDGEISQENGKIIIHNPTLDLLEAFRE
ncbi:nucleoid-associated protein [Haemophilus haemolyticus]|uniref:nucleoid-associated protein n=1 Tax=Haemophilus haemolyticus TaxID=726 RepID=UPI000E587BE8|nr:nucleoid-associated protein [Haemophilus haemolyticus]